MDKKFAYLFPVAKASKQKAHAQDEKQIHQYRPQKGGLDDTDLFSHEGNDEDDKLDGWWRGNVSALLGAGCLESPQRGGEWKGKKELREERGTEKHTVAE